MGLMREKVADINLLWDDGVVVLEDEPLNVMEPETFFFHRLGLNTQVFVIMKKKKINSKKTFKCKTDSIY